MKFIKECWHGQRKLWEAFWLGQLLSTIVDGIVGSICLIATVWGIITLDIAFALTFVVVLITVVWNMISIWSCSPNTPENAWMALAKIYVFLAVVITIMSIIIGAAVVPDFLADQMLLGLMN